MIHGIYFPERVRSPHGNVGVIPPPLPPPEVISEILYVGPLGINGGGDGLGDGDGGAYSSPSHVLTI